MGTLGVYANEEQLIVSDDLKLNTPDPMILHKTLNDLHDRHITHLAMEASSHGLAQHRLDSVEIRAAGFTYLLKLCQKYQWRF
jgi:UDP-N-acetylmuramoyl-L-alanyl-D-glutamate--2,6-diaminopimelate ligase